MTRIRKLLLLPVFVMTCVLTPAAFAHAHPKVTTPAADSTGPAPKAISITFTEAVEPKFSAIHLMDASGNQVTRENAVAVPGDNTTMTLAVPALAAGTYTIHWISVAVDGHKEQGTYKFTVK